MMSSEHSRCRYAQCFSLVVLLPHSLCLCHISTSLTDIPQTSHTLQGCDDACAQNQQQRELQRCGPAGRERHHPCRTVRYSGHTVCISPVCGRIIIVFPSGGILMILHSPYYLPEVFLPGCRIRNKIRWCTYTRCIRYVGREWTRIMFAISCMKFRFGLPMSCLHLLGRLKCIITILWTGILECSSIYFGSSVQF